MLDNYNCTIGQMNYGSSLLHHRSNHAEANTPHSIKGIEEVLGRKPISLEEHYKNVVINPTNISSPVFTVIKKFGKKS